MSLRKLSLVAAAFAVALMVAGDAFAQGGRGGRGGFGGGGFRLPESMLTGLLLRNDKVKTELEIVDDQATDVAKLLESSRTSGRGGRGGDARGGRGGRPGGDARGGRPGGDRGGRPGGDRGQQSEEERAKARAERAKEEAARNKKFNDQLAEILLPHQMDRLSEIRIQIQGLQALDSASVQEALKITDGQKKEMAKVREDSSNARRELFSGLGFGRGGRGGRPGGDGGQGGQRPNFEEIRAKMTKLQEDANKKTLAVLNKDQQAKFEKMKGKKFELSMQDLFSSFRRGGTRGGGTRGGRPGGDGGRPQRPGGDSRRPQRPGGDN